MSVPASFCMLASLLLIAPAAHAQLTVDALELQMVASTTPDVRIINVRNDAAARVQAVVTIEDWERDETGTNRFLPAGTHARSCAARLQVFPTSLVLEPGEQANVRVSLAPGAATSPDAHNCWSIVFLENRATQAAGDRQLSYNVRTGVKIYGEAPQARRDGFIEAMQLADSANARLSVTFSNAGDVQLLVKGSVEVRRLDNSVVHRAELDSFPVLPSQRRRVSADVPSLPSGRYVLLALLDFGGSELVAGQLEYEVP
jgi:P pilus assembly chaperone PapD